MRVALQIVGLLALACAGWLCCEAAWTLRQLRPKLQLTVENLDRTVVTAGATAGKLSDIAGQAQDAMTKLNSAADAETVYWQKGSRESLKVIAATKEVLVRTNLNLNGGPGTIGVLPRLSIALQSTNALTQDAAVRLSDTTKALQPTLDNLARASASAAEQMASPAIAESLENVAESSKNLADGTRSLAGVAADAKNLADYEVQQLERPAKVWLEVLKFVLGEGSAARILLKGAN